MKTKNGHGRAPNSAMVMSEVTREHDYELDFLQSLNRFEEKNKNV